MNTLDSSDSKQDRGDSRIERAPSDLVFVRNRMLFARAALNARGHVQFGLRHIRKFRPSPQGLYIDHCRHIESRSVRIRLWLERASA